MNIIERANHEIGDPAIPEIIAVPLCLILDGIGLAWQTGATVVDVAGRLGAWVHLGLRRLPKPPDLP